MRKLAGLSVVIPTLNAASGLQRTLAVFDDWRASGSFGEVLLADGGSGDATKTIAEDWGAKVLEGTPGRGAQLAAGAKAARGDWLLFLHADTCLERGWEKTVEAFIEAEEKAAQEGGRHAGVFRFALDDADPRARRVETLTHWRVKRLGLAYGDQGLLISRKYYDALGGYRDLPLMEDVDLIRRIGRAGVRELDVRALTSAARYRKNGWFLRPARNITILVLYFLGVPVSLLRRLYG